MNINPNYGSMNLEVERATVKPGVEEAMIGPDDDLVTVNPALEEVLIDPNDDLVLVDSRL